MRLQHLHPWLQTGRDAYLCAEYLWDGEYYVQEPWQIASSYRSCVLLWSHIPDEFPTCRRTGPDAFSVQRRQCFSSCLVSRQGNCCKLNCDEPSLCHEYSLGELCLSSLLPPLVAGLRAATCRALDLVIVRVRGKTQGSNLRSSLRLPDVGTGLVMLHFFGFQNNLLSYFVSLTIYKDPHAFKLRWKNLHSSKLSWKRRGAPYETTILYVGPSMSFHMNLRMVLSYSQSCSGR